MTKGWTAGAVAHAIQGVCDGVAERRLTGLSSLQDAGEYDLAFFAPGHNPGELAGCRAGAVVAKEGQAVPAGVTAIRHPDPRMGFALAGNLMTRSSDTLAGVHPLACVSPAAHVEGASVGPFAVVEAHAVVATGARVMAHAYVGAGAHVGARATVMPHAVLMDRVRLEPDVVVQPGAVLGSEGFGVVRGTDAMARMPHVASVRVGRGAWIGANSCVDRGALTDTTIGDDTHLDNLCQVAHGAAVGDRVVMAAFGGLAGCAKIGEGVSMGGRASVGESVQVGKNARLAAFSGAFRDIDQGSQVGGFPARPQRQWLREKASLARLPDMIRKWGKGDAGRE